ncbi:MAG: sulfatase-like hydrolase/transferase [Bryobacterales bacterium]|nr:sulfatase-like hydrolase/transferase [Bryobacterales bacterium]
MFAWSRRHCLMIALLAACASAPEEPHVQPNVVLFVSDTHRWGAMSFTQTPHVQTPNMELLRDQGVSLDRHYVNLPICTPFRALLMTGRWPYQQGLMANHMSLAQRVDMPDDEKTRGTLAWAFRDAGYATAHFGKWHLGGRDARPFGFDKSVVWQGTNNHRKCRYSVDGGEYVQWEGLSNSTATTEQALEWIGSSAMDGQPFFIVISVNPPHGPFHDAPEAKQALYPDETSLPFHPLDITRDFDQHRDYHALISGMDDDLGLVMARLDALRISDSTILAYTSDHGGMTGIDGVAYGQKRHPNDESTRIPFLVRWPGRIPAGQHSDAPTSTIDVFPTLMSLAGIESEQLGPSAGYVRSLPGTDLSALLRGEPDAKRPDSVFLAHPSNMNNGGSRHEIIWRAVVTDEFTYAVTEDGEHRLWANIDSYQDTNLLDDPAYETTRKELWERLDRWMDEAERPFYDNWFARAAEGEIASWNAEHGLKSEGASRQAGRSAVFDMTASKPR